MDYFDPNQSNFQRVYGEDTLKMAVFGELSGRGESIDNNWVQLLRKKLLLSHSICFHDPYASYAFLDLIIF